MPTKADLEEMHLVDLAVMCGNVADNPSADSVTAEKARGFKRDWVLLIAKETPPPNELKTREEIERQKESLKKRMIEFLAGTP
jgi:hypothetical protein